MIWGEGGEDSLSEERRGKKFPLYKIHHVLVCLPIHLGLVLVLSLKRCCTEEPAQMEKFKATLHLSDSNKGWNSLQHKAGQFWGLDYHIAKLARGCTVLRVTSIQSLGLQSACLLTLDLLQSESSLQLPYAAGVWWGPESSPSLAEVDNDPVGGSSSFGALAFLLSWQVSPVTRLIYWVWYQISIPDLILLPNKQVLAHLGCLDHRISG